MARKKKNNNVGHTLSDVIVRNGIRVSSPYGCYPEDVENVLLKYEDLVNNLQSETQRLDRELERVKSDYKMVDDELRRLKFDMTVMEVPDTSAETDMAMLGRLSNINEDVGTIEPEIPEIVESRIPIDIIENDTGDDLMFDSLVTKKEVTEHSSAQIRNDPSTNAQGIYGDNGKLEIL